MVLASGPAPAHDLHDVGSATLQGMIYDRAPWKAGVQVRWEAGLGNLTGNGVLELEEAAHVLKQFPGVGDVEVVGGKWWNDQDKLSGVGVSGILGRSDFGSIVPLRMFYRGWTCASGTPCPEILAHYSCAGTYSRRNLVLSLNLDCSLAASYGNVPPLWEQRSLAVSVALQPQGFKILQAPPRVYRYRESRGVFTAQ